MFPYTFEPALDIRAMGKVANDIDPSTNPWLLNNNTNNGMAECVSWKQPNDYKSSFVNAGERIKYKLDEYYHKVTNIKTDFEVVRLFTNGQTSNQTSAFHIDYKDPGYYTVILFVDPYWNVAYGGEFVCQSPDKKFHYTSYKSNTAVVIPANWFHRGTPPFACTDRLRTTLAITYFDKSAVHTGH